MHVPAVVANTIDVLATIFGLGYTPPVTQQQGGAGLTDVGPAQAEAAGPGQADEAGPAPAEGVDPSPAEGVDPSPAEGVDPSPAEGVSEVVSAWRALAARHAAVS